MGNADKEEFTSLYLMLCLVVGRLVSRKLPSDALRQVLLPQADGGGCRRLSLLRQRAFKNKLDRRKN